MLQQSHFGCAVYIKEIRTLLIVVYMRDASVGSCISVPGSQLVRPFWGQVAGELCNL